MSALVSTLKRRRAALGDWLTSRGLAHTFSLAPYRLHQLTLPLLREHARGDVLDAGSGRSPYKRWLREQGLRVVSIDVEDRAGEVDVVCDVQHMPEIASASMDTVLCTQVLEHVPRPWDAVAEMARALRPGGRLLLSVPHLSAIHEAPHDYYRYTRFGLEALLTSHGLRIEVLRETGGLLCFLGHGLSLALLTTLGALPGLRTAVWALNYALLVRCLEPLDRLLGAASVFPCDYVVLAVKTADA